MGTYVVRLSNGKEHLYTDVPGKEVSHDHIVDVKDGALFIWVGNALGGGMGEPGHEEKWHQPHECLWRRQWDYIDLVHVYAPGQWTDVWEHHHGPERYEVGRQLNSGQSADAGGDGR
jgi:hypothetical protein